VTEPELRRLVDGFEKGELAPGAGRGAQPPAKAFLGADRRAQPGAGGGRGAGRSPRANWAASR
jgi:hypothetical protein